MSGLAFQHAALGQALQHNRGGGERQNHADRNRLLPAQAEDQGKDGKRGSGQQHLAAPNADNWPFQLPQQGGLQFQPDQEQHQHDTELGNMHHFVVGTDKIEQIGADDHPGNQITQYRSQP